MPLAHLELRKQLEEPLEVGHIRPSHAPFGVPVLFQQKKDEMLRLCVDYKALNKMTIKNKYSVPNAEDLFNKLGVVRIFLKLDLKSRYHQVCILEWDEQKTACVTQYRSYEFIVILFGLTNAPTTFYKFAVVYLDDILVYSCNLKEYIALTSNIGDTKMSSIIFEPF
ncbi:unnamed protein product [Spirodela intermedia]|uniref:Reverse transcriptase domain-containing protein n=1 Tax=Spirodela intermedia TaxID=51605 RepID=A0ABN7E9K2_SPIIN|nr:unnamed protein product [Spirodela intermedia]